MLKSFKPIWAELFWLTIAFLVTILTSVLLLGWDFRSTLDLQRSDTYIVFTASTIIAPLFFLVAFITYFIKEGRNKFSRTLPNIIMVISGLLFILLLAFANREFIKFGTNCGWTAYPPLSAIPEVQSGPVTLNPFADVMTKVLTLIQIIVTIALLYATFHWGRWTKQSSL